ncbi:hypothetical protein BYT27DRAFT_7191363 [Phlegmacium glaucopus]|nr:hypothetical protein BYT27DRAFT_7191363 [Phlegmacium glaucopus]
MSTDNIWSRKTLQLSAPQGRQNWAKRRFSAEKWFRPETNTRPQMIYAICTCEQICPACSRPCNHISLKLTHTTQRDVRVNN